MLYWLDGPLLYVLVGQGGAGKSRLLRELAQHVTAEGHPGVRPRRAAAASSSYTAPGWSSRHRWSATTGW